MNGMLDKKRAMLLDEARKLKSLNDMMGSNNEYLVRAITAHHEYSKGNWGLSFIQHCVKNVDETGKSLFGKDYKECNLKWTDNMLEFWQGLDKRNKKGRPVPGDLVIMHHVKNNQLVTSGQLGIIVNVNRDLTVNTLEGGIVSHFEQEPITQQRIGIHERLRTSKGTARMRVLGYLSPWIDK